MMEGCPFCHVALPTPHPSSFRPSILPNHCGLVKYTCKVATAQEIASVNKVFFKVRKKSGTFRRKVGENWNTCWVNTTDLETFGFRHCDQWKQPINQISYQWSYRSFSIKHPGDYVKLGFKGPVFAIWHLDLSDKIWSIECLKYLIVCFIL